MPFTTTKNLQAINLAFSYKVLRDLHIADIIFSPNLENNAVPTVENRKMGHLILNSLGIDDSRILSEEQIKQLKKDLMFLKPQGGKSPKEHLIGLGIYNIAYQSIDKRKFKNTLTIIQSNMV